jgi:hypothetical protein
MQKTNAGNAHPYRQFLTASLTRARVATEDS